MVVIVCVDDQGGMMFNHRRQSMDREVKREIFRLADGEKLYVSPYTAGQFEAAEQAFLTVTEDILKEGRANDFFFSESPKDLPEESKIDKLILFKWNRIYPADTFLSIPLDEWRMVEKSEFPGYSHEKITEEVYVK